MYIVSGGDIYDLKKAGVRKLQGIVSRTGSIVAGLTSTNVGFQFENRVKCRTSEF
jgi:hypothetical protein